MAAPRRGGEENRALRRRLLGKRVRPPPPLLPPLQAPHRQESQTVNIPHVPGRFTKATVSTVTATSTATASTRSKRVGSALQRVSKLKLFQRPNSTGRPSNDQGQVPTPTVDPEDDTIPCCLDGTDSDESPVENKTAGINVLPSSKPPIFIRNLWKKPLLQTFRRRHYERLIPAVVEEETTVEGREDISPVQTPLSDALRDDASRPVAVETSSQPPKEIEGSIDPVSNADDAITTHDDENNIEAWTPPVPRQRKTKKPKHGDDSVLIGMTVIVDPTMELLELGKQPRCIAKSNLTKLQKAHGCSLPLLGRQDSQEDEESTEASPSSVELLGFPLDSFHDPPMMMQQQGPKRITVMTEKDEEETEITFHTVSEVLVDIPRYLIHDPTFSDMFAPRRHSGENDDEIEIVFFRDDDVPVCAPHGEEDVCTEDANETIDDDDDDEQSRTSEGSSIPLEWMLPHSSKMEVPQYEYDLDLLDDVETPEYEWFLPDHLGIPMVNRHSPRAVFGEPALLEKMKVASCTPSTAAETEMSFDFQATSFEDDSQGSRDEVLSLGSLPSEAVRSLLDFCQMGETPRGQLPGGCGSSLSYQHQHQQDVLLHTKKNVVGSRSVSDSIRIISRGIDF